MKKIIGTLLISFFSVIMAVAQPRFNDERGNMNYRGYELLLNPAAVGSIAAPDIALGIDKQWTGIEGAPLSEMLQFQMPVAVNSGVGIWLHNESYAIQNNLQLGAAYAYKVKIKDHFLSLGLNVSLLLMNERRVTDLNDPNDLAFAEPIDGKFGFNAGFGAYYFGDKFYAGFSIPQLLMNDTKENRLSNGFDVARAQYYFTGGYRFDVANKISLTPSALLQLSGATSVGYEFMLTALYNKRFEVGAGYADHVGLQFAVGVTFLKNLSLRYRYAQNLNANIHAGSSHFVVLRFVWGGTQEKQLNTN
jgi:type IX secretion system PorP/SprF family membrane protein